MTIRDDVERYIQFGERTFARESPFLQMSPMVKSMDAGSYLRQFDKAQNYVIAGDAERLAWIGGSYFIVLQGMVADYLIGELGQGEMLFLLDQRRKEADRELRKNGYDARLEVKVLEVRFAELSAELARVEQIVQDAKN